jgi:hypothetical protein
MAGQTEASGQQQGFQAALAANQQEYQDVLGGRQSYLSGGPQVAENQNQLDIQRGEAVTQANLQNAQMANQYNLSAAGMANNFMLNPNVNPNAWNQQNYEDRFKTNAYNNQLTQSAIMAPFSAIGSLFGAGGAFGSSGAFGGGDTGGAFH